MSVAKYLVLAKPIELHGKKHDRIGFREPTGKEYLDVGDPRSWAVTKDGTRYLYDNDLAIKAYIDKCVEGDDGTVLLQLMGLADAQKAKEIVLSFFTDAAEANSKE